MDARELDQFFTKPDVAEGCWRSLQPVLDELAGARLPGWRFIEPGAGDGGFYDLLPRRRRIGIDIAPRRPEFMEQDFLRWDYEPPAPRRDMVVVGNPPFGRRGDLAVAFFRKAAELSDTIAFVVPVIFRKYAIHKQLPDGFRWVHALDLPRDAFWTADAPTYEVNTEFQVWTRLPSGHEDRRRFTSPPRRHPDFELYQYNNTIGALKVFENEFDFAVPCQGWQDYSRRESDPDRCERHKQWMLVKASTGKARARLHGEIDYGELALRHTTSVPGFRKGDLVTEYAERYGA